jgi:hypothetical protein
VVLRPVSCRLTKKIKFIEIPCKIGGQKNDPLPMTGSVEEAEEDIRDNAKNQKTNAGRK